MHCLDLIVTTVFTSCHDPVSFPLFVVLTLLVLFLSTSQDSLKMVCVRPIRRGEEVFNTYGQMANWQLLHMYGFTESHQSNGNDTADIPITNLHKVATEGEWRDCVGNLTAPREREALKEEPR